MSRMDSSIVIIKNQSRTRIKRMIVTMEEMERKSKYKLMEGDGVIKNMYCFKTLLLNMGKIGMR
jgi:hypothetical protein